MTQLDKRQHVQQHIFYVLFACLRDLGVLQAADDAAEAQWFPMSTIPDLAFDHKLVVRECLKKAATLPEAQGTSIQAGLQTGIDSLVGDWRAGA